ncbi:flavin-containing monooxygenase [Glutamicibacter sp.]|uniref:flavin-containing monooxygenase n=1 Tax=Glutamicibacter sp. TaxID=1931995 RepID=UPI003D6AF9D7
MNDAQHTYEAIILGAGFGGLGMGAQLKQAGIDNFLIIDRGDSVGGVWRENTYPGAACDTEAHLYCYSFFPHLRVSRMYADREELLKYQQDLAENFGLAEQLRLSTEVAEARWDAKAALWNITCGDGTIHSARVFIPAWGQLNSPSVPHLEGIQDFRGSAFHSARWDHDVQLEGKKVISIGTAASAVQYVPEVAAVAGHLEVFQRSANWMMPRNQIIFSEEQLDAYANDPSLFNASRSELHAFRENGFERTRLASEAQQEGMRLALAHLASQVPDESLRAALTPEYEFGCKRILRSDDYYPALMRENVNLVTEHVSHIEETGVRTADGVLHEADVIIFGTGFSSQAFHGDLRVIGASGETLSDRWSEGAEAYLGISVDGFPNMFLVYGPNTNLNHNSIITMLEIQQQYILQVLDALRSSEGGSVEVRGRQLTEFNKNLQLEMQGSAFSSDCSSWYKNAAGKVINNWSGTVDEYRTLADSWRAEDYVLSGAPLQLNRTRVDV